MCDASLGNYLKCSLGGFLTEQRREDELEVVPFMPWQAVVFLGHSKGEFCHASQDKVWSERFKLLRKRLKREWVDLIFRRMERNVTGDFEFTVVSIEFPVLASVVGRGRSFAEKTSIRVSYVGEKNLKLESLRRKMRHVYKHKEMA